MFRENKKPASSVGDAGLRNIFFGIPAVRFHAPLGFASPGCPGFTLIGKYGLETVLKQHSILINANVKFSNFTQNKVNPFHHA